MRKIMTIDKIAEMQEAGEFPLCPRCGEPLKDRLHTNAMSRVADVYVCDACGTAEALEAFLGHPRSVEDWWCMQIDD